MNRKKYMKEYNRQYYDNNIERLEEEHKRYYKNNREEILKQKTQYCKNNAEKIKKYAKQWRKNNTEYIKQYCRDNSEKLSKRSRQWSRDNRGKVNKRANQYYKDRYRTDLKFNLNEKIKIMIIRSLKGSKNGRRWETLVGYTLGDLIKRLKKTMLKGYTWQDYLEGKLHIDHKIPKSVFNFSKPEHIDFQRCWALKNLQLLPAEENWRKSNKLEKAFQLGLKI